MCDHALEMLRARRRAREKLLDSVNAGDEVRIRGQGNTQLVGRAMRLDAAGWVLDTGVQATLAVATVNNIVDVQPPKPSG